jgi:hypothetical protein
VPRPHAAPVRGYARDVPVGRATRPGLWWDIGAILGFIAGAFYLTSRLWRGLSHVRGTNAPDQAQFEWMLAHGARVVRHLDYPFVTTKMNAPDGVNLMANTSVLGLSVPMSPLTLVFGPHTTFALLMTTAYAATGIAWYYVLSRHVVAAPGAAVLGAAFCAFAPGMVSHGNGHPNIVAQFLVPFIVWRALTLGRSGRPFREGTVLGLLVTWQAFINEEILLLTALGVGSFTLIVGLFRRVHRQRIVPFLASLGVAVLIAGALLAYPLLVQFTGPGTYHGLSANIQQYGANLASYPAFSQLSLAGSEHTARGLAQNPTEENSFLGWPSLILVGAVVTYLSRKLTALAVAATGAVFAICSLGPVVKWRSTGLGSGPWAAMQSLPILDTVVPTRFALATVPITGVLLAMGWDQWRRHGQPHARTRAVREGGWRSNRLGRSLRYASYALVPAAFAAALLPAAPRPLPVVHQAKTPALLVNGRLHEYLTGNRSVVFVPPPQSRYPEPLAWAAQAGLSFRISRGYFLGPATGSDEPGGPKHSIFSAPPRPTSSLLMAVHDRRWNPRITERMRDQAAADMRYWRAGAVVLVPGRSTGPLLRTTTGLLGIQPQWMDGAWLWDVRQLR